MPWTNNDGLVVRFGTEEALNGNRGGLSPAHGPWQVLETRINAAATDIASSATVPNESILMLPRGARVEKVEILVETAFTSGGSATLSIGTLTLARAAQSATGLVNGQTVASLTAGALITIITGSGTAGALIGTVLANPGLISMQYGTAAFTAGKALVRIYYYMPT